MDIIICLTANDIITTKNGLHYQIEPLHGIQKGPVNIILNFTPDAMDEIIKDVGKIKTEEEAKKEKAKKELH